MLIYRILFQIIVVILQSIMLVYKNEQINLQFYNSLL